MEFDVLKDKLQANLQKNYKVSLGFDGYLDEIIEAVNSRIDLDHHKKIETITDFGHRILNAAGKSTNIELHTNQWKLGGNGPIMGNSMAQMSIHVNYIGALGYPETHQTFKDLSPFFKSTTIEEPGHTMALEFHDGKIMFGRLAMKHLNWDNLIQRAGMDECIKFFTECDLLGMVNWTQTPHMPQMWDIMIDDFLPMQNFTKKPYLFIDLADPQKREQDDILKMIDQLKQFGQFYNVILGLNEKESYEIAQTLEINHQTETPEALMDLASKIRNQINIHCCVIHPVKFAVCSLESGEYHKSGPYIPNPLISTGAGDHFNAGFCYGILSGFTPLEALTVGVSNSGYYVRTAKSGSIPNLIQFIDDWKNNNI